MKQAETVNDFCPIIDVIFDIEIGITIKTDLRRHTLIFPTLYRIFLANDVQSK